MDFYNYFSKAENIVQLISLVFFSVITILLFLKTGNVKHLERWLEQYFSEDNNILGGTTMKYRTEDYKKGSKSQATAFDNVLYQYKLNKVTGKLEEVDKIDLQEFINSSLSQCLNAIMDKFLPCPENCENSSELSEVKTVQNDIDFLQEYNATLDRVKEKYDLPENMSYDAVLSFLDKQKAVVSATIQASEKGGNNDEKKENE